MLLKDCPEEHELDGVLIRGKDSMLAAIKCFDIYPKHTLPSIAQAVLQVTNTMDLFEKYTIEPQGLWAALIGAEADVSGSGFIIDSMDPSKIKAPTYVADCEAQTLEIRTDLQTCARIYEAIKILENCGWEVITAN